MFRATCKILIILFLCVHSSEIIASNNCREVLRGLINEGKNGSKTDHLADSIRKIDEFFNKYTFEGKPDLYKKRLKELKKSLLKGGVFSEVVEIDARPVLEIIYSDLVFSPLNRYLRAFNHKANSPRLIIDPIELGDGTAGLYFENSIYISLTELSKIMNRAGDFSTLSHEWRHAHLSRRLDIHRIWIESTTPEIRPVIAKGFYDDYFRAEEIYTWTRDMIYYLRRYIRNPNSADKKILKSSISNTLFIVKKATQQYESVSKIIAKKIVNHFKKGVDAKKMPLENGFYEVKYRNLIFQFPQEYIDTILRQDFLRKMDAYKKNHSLMFYSQYFSGPTNKLEKMVVKSIIDDHLGYLKDLSREIQGLERAVGRLSEGLSDQELRELRSFNQRIARLSLKNPRLSL